MEFIRNLDMISVSTFQWVVASSGMKRFVSLQRALGCFYYLFFQQLLLHHTFSVNIIFYFILFISELTKVKLMQQIHITHNCLT